MPFYDSKGGTNYTVSGLIALLAAGVTAIVATTFTTTNLLVTEQAVPALSAAGQAKIYADSTAHNLQVSQNGGAYAAIGGGGGSFSTLTGGTNTTAAMVVGTGASLATSGSGTIAATSTTTNANLTGEVTSVGNAASLGSFTSASLATALTNETGSGAAVFATSPTFVTPILGTPTSGTATNLTGLPLTSGVTGTLPVANGGTGVTASTGTVAVVLSTSPTLITPVLGVASGTSFAITGTGGNGFETYPTQSSPPAAPASGFREFADSTGRKSWIRQSDGFIRTWDATITADRVFTLQDVSDTVVFRATTDTLTNKRITKRTVTAADATSVTPNSDNADITSQANTQATGTLTINADAGTPTNGQFWLFKIKSTNVQTYSWNAVYVSGTDISLPTVSTAAKIDYIGFVYDSLNSKWHITSLARGY